MIQDGNRARRHGGSRWPCSAVSLSLTISGEGILIHSHRAIEGDTEQIGGEGKHAR